METNDNAQTSPVAAPDQRPTEFCSSTLNRLATALAKAQAAFGAIERTRTVTVRTKDSGSYTFSYAPLDTVLAATMPALSANGLSLTSLVVAGGARLRTLLLHESGEFIAVELEMPVTEGPQKFGSALTYLRRYSIVALLGVASEEDDDGNAAEGNHRDIQTRPRREQPSAAPQPAAPVTKSSHVADRAEAAGEIAPQPMTAEQSDEIADLFKRLKVSRVAATERVKSITGKKGPFEMTDDDARKLIDVLKGELPQAAGAAS